MNFAIWASFLATTTTHWLQNSFSQGQIIKLSQKYPMKLFPIYDVCFDNSLHITGVFRSLKYIFWLIYKLIYRCVCWTFIGQIRRLFVKTISPFPSTVALIKLSRWELSVKWETGYYCHIWLRIVLVFLSRFEVLRDISTHQSEHQLIYIDAPYLGYACSHGYRSILIGGKYSEMTNFSLL